MRTRRLPIRLIKGLLAALSTIVALGTTEAALRVLDWPSSDPVWRETAATGFGFAPNLQYRHMQPEYDVAFSTNSHGLRDDEIAPKTGRRILLLGDSFTCGYGVERSEMFADLVEQRMGCEIVNAAVGGYETIHQLRYVQAEGRALSPDLVVLALYLGNDVTGNREWTCDNDGRLVRVDGRPALNPPCEPKLLSLAKRSVSVRRAFHAARQAWTGRVALSEWRPDRSYLNLCVAANSAEAQADWEETYRLVKQLRDEVAAQGGRLLVVTIPTRIDVELDVRQRWEREHLDQAGRLDFARPTRDASEMLDQLGIAHLSLLEPLRAEHARLDAPLYYPHDGHLNSRGNARVAEHVAAWLSGHLSEMR